MNNYGLATADRLTHIKIVAVALVACIAVIGTPLGLLVRRWR